MAVGGSVVADPKEPRDPGGWSTPNPGRTSDGVRVRSGEIKDRQSRRVIRPRVGKVETEWVSAGSPSDHTRETSRPDWDGEGKYL